VSISLELKLIRVETESLILKKYIHLNYQSLG
jgi:hypothetical protein